MRKLLMNKKGVTPVISAVIMILVVMIGMSALFSFFVSYSKDYQIGSGSAVFEVMTIEDLWFGDENNVTLWLFNYGKVDIKISGIYVDGSSIDLNTDDLSIDVGAHRQFTFFMPYDEPLNPPSYHLKIVTNRGTSFEGDYTP